MEEPVHSIISRPHDPASVRLLSARNQLSLDAYCPQLYIREIVAVASSFQWEETRCPGPGVLLSFLEPSPLRRYWRVQLPQPPLEEGNLDSRLIVPIAKRIIDKSCIMM